MHLDKDAGHEVEGTSLETLLLASFAGSLSFLLSEGNNLVERCMQFI